MGEEIVTNWSPLVVCHKLKYYTQLYFRGLERKQLVEMRKGHVAQARTTQATSRESMTFADTDAFLVNSQLYFTVFAVYVTASSEIVLPKLVSVALRN